MKTCSGPNRCRIIATIAFFCIHTLSLTALANCYVPIALWGVPPQALLLLCPLFLLLHVFPNLPAECFLARKLRMARRGVILLWHFLIALVPTIVLQLVWAVILMPSEWLSWLVGALIATLILAAVFWNGMITVYLFSSQMGIYRRAVGALLGMIPVLNVIQLVKIIRTVTDEVRSETKRRYAQLERRDERLCETRYPLLLVHGVFFRDSVFFNYWGRIPEALEADGARIFYGEHESAASVENAAKELAERIRNITESTGCGKVNVIAHSKGGLDCRYAIERLGVAPLVASLTTINTPHRGCEFADELLENIPNDVQNKVAGGYNTAMKALGDQNPDFMAAVRDLTASACARMNEEIGMTLPGDIFVQSVGSRLERASGGRFPLNMTYSLVKRFDGPNDGLVSEASFRFGSHYRLLTTKGSRGISHGDMIDLNRENIPGFDVREFYVELVNDLKRRGL